MGGQERTGTDDQRTGTALDKRREGGLDVAAGPDIENYQLLSDGLRRGFHVFSLRLGFWTVRVHQYANSYRLGHELV